MKWQEQQTVNVQEEIFVKLLTFLNSARIFYQNQEIAFRTLKRTNNTLATLEEMGKNKRIKLILEIGKTVYRIEEDNK